MMYGWIPSIEPKAFCVFGKGHTNIVRHSLWFLLIVMMSWIASAPTAKANPVIIYTTDLPGLHQQDGQGAYDTIIAQALETKGVDARLVFLPIARAISGFQTCQDCCISPCNDTPGVTHCPGATVSEAFSEIRLHVFTAPNTDPIESLNENSSLRFGAEFGMPLGRKTESLNLDITRLETIHQAARMLDIKRLDAFLGWEPDVKEHFKQQNLPMLAYDPNAPLETIREGIACKGPSTQKLMGAVNDILADRARDRIVSD